MVNAVSAPASPKLRWITATLLLVAAGLAIALPFLSSTLVTIALGGVAIAAGISQVLRLTSVEGSRGKVFRASRRRLRSPIIQVCARHDHALHGSTWTGDS